MICWQWPAVLAGFWPAPAQFLSASTVDPDGPTGQRWAKEELAKSIYHDSPSPLARALRWLADLLFGGDNSLPALSMRWQVLALVVGAALVLVALAWWLRPRRATRGATVPTGLDGAGNIFDAEVFNATEFWNRARQAQNRADYQQACIEGFRALVMRGHEKQLLTDPLLLTARRAAAILAQYWPQQSPQWATAPQLFNATRFGNHPAGPDDFALLAQLWQTVATSAPQPKAPAKDAAPTPAAPTAPATGSFSTADGGRQ